MSTRRAGSAETETSSTPARRSRRSSTAEGAELYPPNDEVFGSQRPSIGDEVSSSPSARFSSVKISAIKATRLGGRLGSGSKEVVGNNSPKIASVPLPTIEHIKLVGERKLIKTATILQLIEEYTENSADAESIQHLAVAHGHFISNLELLLAIIKQYKLIQDTSANPNFQKQYRLINILKTWLAIDKICINSSPFSETLHEFVDYLNQTSASIGSYFTSAIELRTSLSSNSTVDALQLGASALSTKFSSDLPRLTEFGESEIARQLCLIDQFLLKNIPLHEFHKCRWTKHEAPKIEFAGSFANKLSYWFSLQILAETKVKDQLKLWSQVVNIGKDLLQLQDFNSLLAVYLSLQNPRIKQMQLEWGSKAKKSVQTLRQIEAVMSPVNNFAAYRAHIRELHYPLIPCLEIFLKDLLYQAEGSADYVEDERSLNVLKLDSMGKLIMQVVNSQSTSYEFENNEGLGALFASFLNRPVAELTDELENLIDNSDWNEYLSMSKKDIEALVSKDDSEGVADSDPALERKQKRSTEKKRSDSVLKDQLLQKDAEIASLKAKVLELESEVRRLKKGKD